MCCSTFWMLLRQGQRRSERIDIGFDAFGQASPPRGPWACGAWAEAWPGSRSRRKQGLQPDRIRDATYDERCRLPATGGLSAAALMLSAQTRGGTAGRRVEEMINLGSRLSLAADCSERTARRLLQLTGRIARPRPRRLSRSRVDLSSALRALCGCLEPRGLPVCRIATPCRSSARRRSSKARATASRRVEAYHDCADTATGPSGPCTWPAGAGSRDGHDQRAVVREDQRESALPALGVMGRQGPRLPGPADVRDGGQLEHGRRVPARHGAVEPDPRRAVGAGGDADWHGGRQ